MKVVLLVVLVLIVLGLTNWALGYNLGETEATGARRSRTGVALVIGNGSEYGSDWRPLPTATADAVAVTAALEAQNYRVISVTDGSEEEMLAALARFKAALDDEQALREDEQEGKEDGEGVPDIAGVVYFSGHGCHVDGQNYLVAVDGPCDGTKTGCVPTSALFDALDGATNSGPGIVILDAGQENQHDEALSCPLSQVRRIREPVKLGAEAAGWTFERAALVAYLEHSSKSPRTGKDLPDTEIVPESIQLPLKI